MILTSNIQFVFFLINIFIRVKKNIYFIQTFLQLTMGT